MKKQIKALLEKQYLTGDDTGRLMILDLLTAYQSLSEGGEGEGVLTDAEKTDIVNNLVLPGDIQRFNDYRGLHDYLSSASAVVESYVKTYEVYHLKLLHLLTNMKYAEEEAIRANRRPVVMTKRQYEQLIQSGEPLPSRGVAVLQEAPAAKAHIDKNGFYAEPEPDIVRDYKAESLLLNYSDFITEALSGMKDMLAECLARKKALELVASYSKIPQIKKLITPVNEERLTLLNDFMLSVVNLVHRDNSGSERELKKSLLKILRPIDLATLEPTAQAIKKTRRTLNFSVIKNNSEAFVASLKREWRDDCQ